MKENLTETEVRRVWTRVFGFKKGNIVRPKYGKCYWEIYAVYEEYDMIKVRRLRRDRYGCFTPEEVVTTFWSYQIVEVQSKESVGDTFPSQVFR